ncbi:hypothetical protein N7474_005155 [Penicillium riverlandense]|uniref:uncharacterized protein n=1 Tax=Penicillium riverlandense TaxID=1903569 RepID=UPI0025476827|nr:uncharacterized protein N7474_005155 [Penicillium riverlandense]KAJ5819564.1 hypothetical protein N7474_005155 [Penicillium riverlandense]
MKFTLVSSALLLATSAMANPNPEVPDVNSILSDAGVGISKGINGINDLPAEATSIWEEVKTGGENAVKTLTGEGAQIASAAESAYSAGVTNLQSAGSEIAHKWSTATSETTTTNSDGQATATEATKMTMNPSASATGSPSGTTNGAVARPTAVGAAVAGMAGMLGIMAAL